MVMHYQNPIIRGMYPDPSIVQVDGVYYMVNSTFEYYPGIAISRSTDLLNWEKLPSIAAHFSQADLRQAKSNEGIFAVCIRYFKGRFYVITTNFSEFKTIIIRGALSADGQAIKWEDTRVTVNVHGIDPDLYFEDDRTYLQFTGYIDDKGTKAIQQVEIDLETGAILRGPEVLTLGTGGRDVEGPHIIKKDGWYYLLIAEGGTGVGHMITMFRSRNLWGPFTTEPTVNPLFTNRDRAEEPLQNIGHADLFQDPAGNWWLTCLGTRPAAVGFTRLTNLGRETLLYPVEWTQDWPVIYTGVPAETVELKNFPQHAETLTEPQQLSAFVDTFETKELHPEWVTLRDRVADLTVGSGQLRLIGNNLTLADLGTPAFVGLRQTEQEECFECTLDLEHTQINEGSIGLAAMINSDHYAMILIKKVANGYQILRQQKVADIDITEILGEMQQLPQTLSIINRKETKTFCATDKQTKEQLSFTTAAIHFSNEAIAALNTGDFQGLYASGNAEMVITRAERRPLGE